MRTRFPNTCTITRTAETISATGGVPVAGTTSTIYSGRCDAQDNGRRFNVSAGIVNTRGSATVFLPFDTVLTDDVRPGDLITITWSSGTTKAGRVDNSDNLDSGLLVLYS